MIFWVLVLILLVMVMVMFLRKEEGFEAKGWQHMLPFAKGWQHMLPFAKGWRPLSPLETKNYLLADVDGYMARLSSADYVARGLPLRLGQDKHRSIARRACDAPYALGDGGYANYLANAVYPECPNMDKLIAEADAIIDRFQDVEDGWLNKAKLQELPWIIGISPAGYEFDLPHTRGMVIMLPLSNGMLCGADVLVHEKLHVYQKMYSKDFEKYLKKEGFQVCRSNNKLEFAANPDSDGQVYERDGVPWYGYYAKDLKKGFRSIRYTPIDDPRYDCPREYAVYTLLERYTAGREAAT
jgi:hypothetical protein